jgi:hypothetical protein
MITWLGSMDWVSTCITMMAAMMVLFSMGPYAAGCSSSWVPYLNA